MQALFKRSFLVAHVCPWWGGYFIDNGLRHLIHHPERILRPYMDRGLHVLDFGCGMGMFAIAMAKLVGEEGHVLAVDLQQQMLNTLSKRAERAGVGSRIRTHQCSANSLDLDVSIDFALAFYSAHEVPDVAKLLAEIHGLLKNGGRFLLVEPKGHVRQRQFAAMLDCAEGVGFAVVERPRVRFSHVALLVRS
jgi:ubiquinone/menaquinone biosynthesis C-methylase UbiE